MPFPLLLAILLTRGQEPPATSVVLYRGASLFGSPGAPNYQDVEDTTLDQSTPDVQRGGEYTLQGGTGHTILIRFGSLPAALGPNVRIADAKLILSETSLSTPRLHSIGVVTRPWEEGPYHVEYQAPKFVKDKDGKDQPVPLPKRYGATWKNRFDNLPGSGWQSQGATSEADAAPIAGAVAKVDTNQFEIDGLGPSVQAMLANPGSNNGFDLTFDTDAEFFSSECSGGKPRLVVTLAPATPANGGDIAIETITPGSSGFTAHLKNIGSQPVPSIRTTWSVDAREGSTLEIPGAIAPGQSKDIPFEGSPRTNGSDHRLGAISLRIGDASDSNLADKQLTVYPAGLAISALIEQRLLPGTSEVLSPRGKGLANWLQSQMSIANDIYLARSRYSFAPEGCLERVRLAEIKEVGATIDGPAPVGIPVEVKVPAAGLPYIDFDFIKRVLIAIGAPDLGRTAFPRGSEAVKVPGWNIAGLSIAPDITGGGDTRFDGGIPSQLLLPQSAIDDPTLANIPFEANGLLSSNAVGVLDSVISERLSERAAGLAETYSKMPKTIFVDAADANGRPFKNVTLDFFQSHAGVVGDQPAFSLTTSDSGAALLPRRAVPGTQVTNPFGSKDLDGDGAFLIRTTANGETAWTWLHAWQLQTATFRGDSTFASVPIYFVLASGPVDRTSNHASGRVVTDSRGSLPTKLSPLVDGTGNTSVELPSNPGDWIELDLNRDWTLAELRLTTKGDPMWNSFKIQVYQTGQKPEAALTWSSEVDWKWSAEARGNLDSNGKTSLTYNGPLVQIRYIRIVCTRPGKGNLAQIEAFSSKAAP